MTLLEAQFLFAKLLPRLLDRAVELGYGITMGEVWRSTATARVMAEQHRGIAHSLHTDRLAVDINLFHGAEYITDSETHRVLGEWWEQLHPACRWGGRFRDGNHYSVSPDGRRA